MRSIGQVAWLSISIIFIVLAVLFTLSNNTVTTLKLWPIESTYSLPTWLAFITSFLAGGLMSGLLLWTQLFTIRSRLWRLQKKYDELKRLNDQKKNLIKERAHPYTCCCFVVCFVVCFSLEFRGQPMD